MRVTGQQVFSLVVAAAIAVGGFVGWALQPALAGGTPGVGCSGPNVVDGRIDDAFNRVADFQFNLGIPYGSNNNPVVRTKGWGDFTTYADLVTPARNQKPGQHNKVILTPYQNQLGKAMLVKVQIGRGLANDAGQIFLNGHRPLCANASANDYGFQVPTANPTYLTFEWSGAANNCSPLVLDFFNQAAELANHQAIDPAGLAGTGLIQIWFLS